MRQILHILKYELYRIRGWRLFLLMPLLAILSYSSILAVGKLTRYGYLSLNEAVELFSRDFDSLQAYRKWYSDYMLYQLFGTQPVFRWLAILVAGYFVSLSHENSSFIRLIFAGHKRKNILIVSCLFCLIFLCALSLTGCLLNMTVVARYWTGVIPTTKVFQVIVYRLIFDIETVSVAVLLAFATKKLMTTAASGFILCYLLTSLEAHLPQLSSDSILGLVIRYLPSIGGNVVWSSLSLRDIVVAAIVTIVSLVVSYIIFEKSSLK